ncbi:chromosome partitioning protein ParA [Bacillus mojavensis]|uniref:chromosome partitioning protein ParA n=1 Tax=Bacillus mojavensis TaxID=72360 RepID=UPI00398B9EB0
MIEKYTTQVSLDFFNGGETDLKDTIEEIKLFAKTYENDKVTVLSVTENESSKGKIIKFFYSTREIQII